LRTDAAAPVDWELDCWFEFKIRDFKLELTIKN
jgi:hypothetical protein